MQTSNRPDAFAPVWRPKHPGRIARDQLADGGCSRRLANEDLVLARSVVATERHASAKLFEMLAEHIGSSFDAKSSSPAFNFRRSRRSGDRSDDGVGVGAVFLGPRSWSRTVSLPAHPENIFGCEHQHAAGSTLGKPSALSVAEESHLFLRRAPLNPRAPVHSGGGQGLRSLEFIGIRHGLRFAAPLFTGSRCTAVWTTCSCPNQNERGGGSNEKEEYTETFFFSFFPFFLVFFLSLFLSLSLSFVILVFWGVRGWVGM